MTPEELRRLLPGVLEPVVGGPVTVANPRALTGGASRSTWVFETDPQTFARAGLAEMEEAQSAKLWSGSSAHFSAVIR